MSHLDVFDGLAAAGWFALVDADGDPIQVLSDVPAPGVWQSAEYDNNGRVRVGVAVVMVTPAGRAQVCTVNPPIPVSAGVKARVHFGAPGCDKEFRATRDRMFAEAMAASLVMPWVDA